MSVAQSHTAQIHTAAVVAVEAALRARTGLVLGGERRADLSRSLDKAMGAIDPAQWAARLETDTALFDRVVADVTVGETYFFRDPAHFAFLRETFLPAFRRRAARNLRAWSAGCSSGEEPYSLAILFDGAGVGANILATDISCPALDKARAGIYGRWSLRGDGARLVGDALRPCARSRTETFEVSDRLKRQVKFVQMNLATDGDLSVAAAGAMDVIFCRNVLIYLEPAAIRRIARRFYDVLGEGGVLLTGPSDPLLADAAPFTCEYTSHGVIYHKKSGHKKNRPGTGASLPAAIPLPEDPLPPAPSPPPLPVRDNRDDAAPAAARVDDAAAAVLAIHARANAGDGEQAVVLAARAAKTHPASREVSYLHGILLMNLGRFDEADTVLKRVVYLDPALAVVHFTLGNLRLRMGDLAGARRAFTAAHKAAAARPADEVLALSEGETAGQLALAASRLARRDGA